MEKSVGDHVVDLQLEESVKAAETNELKKIAEMEKKSQQESMLREHALNQQLAGTNARENVRRRVEEQGTAAVQDEHATAATSGLPGAPSQRGKHCVFCKIPMKLIKANMGLSGPAQTTGRLVALTHSSIAASVWRTRRMKAKHRRLLLSRVLPRTCLVLHTTTCSCHG
jgi:hypothetical protein